MDWGQKLQAKLATLSESSSKESLQTLAKWIGFNRKHSASFCPIFVTALTTNVALQPQYIACITLVCLLDHGNSKKWDRSLDLRVSLAENAIIPAVSVLQEEGRKELTTSLKDMDKANSFGGPTLINQIKKKLQQRNENDQELKEEEKEAEVELPSKEVVSEPQDPASAEEDISASTRRPSLTHVESAPVEYNFEASGVDAKEVKPKEFIEPCRTIANLSIVRDLRNDGALQLSSQLSSLPEDIRKVCAQSAAGKPVELDEATARDFCRRMDPALLDMDINEQINNIKDFRKVVIQTRKARDELITMLKQSRCQFGASEAAQSFLGADGATTELVERQQILADAMELEGVEPPKLKKVEAKELVPLAWYSEPETKRVKIE